MKRFRAFGLAALVVLCVAVNHAAAPLSPIPDPEARSDNGYATIPVQASKSGLVVDTSNRQDVVNFFNDVYLPTLNVDAEWDGDLDGCDPGTVSQAYLAAVLQRLNWFRAMAGVPANVTFDPTLNVKCQDAALMFIANGELPSQGFAGDILIFAFGCVLLAARRPRAYCGGIRD